MPALQERLKLFFLNDFKSAVKPETATEDTDSTVVTSSTLAFCSVMMPSIAHVSTHQSVQSSKQRI